MQTRRLFFFFLLILSLPLPVRAGLQPGSPQVFFEPNRGQAPMPVRYLGHGADSRIQVFDDGFELQGVRLRWLGAQNPGRFQALDPLPGRIHHYRPGLRLEGLPAFTRLRRRALYPGVDLVYRFQPQGRLEYDLLLAPGADPGRLRLRVEGAMGLHLDEAGELVMETPHGVVHQAAPQVFQYRHGRREAVAARFVWRQPGRELGVQLAAYDDTRELVIDPVVSFSSYLGGDAGDNVHALAWTADGMLLVAGTTATRVRLGADGQVSVDDSGFPLAGFSPPASPGAADAACGYAYDDTRGQGEEQVVLRYDGFLSKLDPATGQLVFSTFFGGCGNDTVRDIAVDGEGNIYLTGMTLSTDFPVTVGPTVLSAGNADKSDAFVAKFAADGSLIYARYLGGSEDDFGRALAVDQRGFAYVTGFTRSSDFEGNRCGQAGGWRCLAGGSDVFVARLWSTGETVDYMNYLGGEQDDYAAAIALRDDADAARVGIFVAGATASADFPVTAGAYSRYQAKDVACGRAGSSAVAGLHVCTDAFVAGLGERGKRLDMAVVFGGEEDDTAVDLELSPAGTLVVAGSTRSAGVVLNSGNAIDPDMPENQSLLRRFPLYRPLRDAAGQGDRLRDTASSEAFVSEFSSDGSRLLFSSFLRGSDTDVASAVSVTADDRIYLVGRSRSRDFFPLKQALQASAIAEDLFLVELDAQRQVVQATLLGAEHLDGANALAVRQTADETLVALGGNTYSRDFPVRNAIQAVPAGGDSDGFVLTLREAADDPAVDLSVSLSLSRSTATVGDSVDVLVRVANQAAIGAPGVGLELSYPPGLDLRVVNGDCVVQGRRLFCRLGDLAAAGGEGDSLQVRLDALPRFAGDMGLEAMARALVHDADLADNSARAMLRVNDGGGRSGALSVGLVLLLAGLLLNRARRSFTCAHRLRP